MRFRAVRPRRVFLAFLLAAAATAVALAAFRPVRFDSREEPFEIPKGTWARRMAGDKIEILPAKIYLMLEVRDVLFLRNLDDVPQIFGPTLLMPGQSFRLPFHTASENLFACTAHANGQLMVVVEEKPDSAAGRLSWRARWLARKISQRFQAQHA